VVNRVTASHKYTDGAVAMFGGRRSEQLGFLQQPDRPGAGAQLGDRDGVRLELVERGLGLRRRDPRGDRILEAVAVGAELLPLGRIEDRQPLQDGDEQPLAEIGPENERRAASVE
jgi:hypothetical protein